MVKIILSGDMVYFEKSIFLLFLCVLNLYNLVVQFPLRVLRNIDYIICLFRDIIVCWSVQLHTSVRRL